MEKIKNDTKYFDILKIIVTPIKIVTTRQNLAMASVAFINDICDTKLNLSQINIGIDDQTSGIYLIINENNIDDNILDIMSGYFNINEAYITMDDILRGIFDIEDSELFYAYANDDECENDGDDDIFIYISLSAYERLKDRIHNWMTEVTNIKFKNY